MNHKLKQLSLALMQARQARKLTQAELSDKTGIDQAHISRIEQGKKNITIISLIDLARVLGLEVMLIPKNLVRLVSSLTKNRKEQIEIPAYILDDEDEDDDN
jgi:transcriptional regulator with XRE-family HTH domain